MDERFEFGCILVGEAVKLYANRVRDFIDMADKAKNVQEETVEIERDLKHV